MHPIARNTPAITADRFWAWSLAFYADPAVAAACLALQEEHGADVNVVLILLWLAAEGAAALDAPQVAALDAAIAVWRTEVIVPLRTLRRALKGRGEDAVRRPIASAELEAERSAQRRLVASLPPVQPGVGSARERAAASLRGCHLDGVAAAAVLLERLAGR